MDEGPLRQHLKTLLAEESAHVSFDAAVAHFPVDRAGEIPAGWAWSAWQLLEHVRIAEEDIVAYCQAGAYLPLRWPQDYWPDEPAPPSDTAWEESVHGVRRARAKALALLEDPTISLFDIVPNSDSHTYLRELLLIADHAAYHTGQMVALRRALGVWPS